MCNGYTDAGIPDLAADWSAPVRITGPRGPISYDYRIETRYHIGNETKPADLPTAVEWKKLEGELKVTKDNPYIWAADYLVRYSMKYSTDDDGNYILDEDTGEYLVEPITNADGEEIYTVIEPYGYYRMSGLNGENGNTRNYLTYLSNSITLKIKTFTDNNLFIANSLTDINYELDFDKLTFIDGYVGKFANIGSANMIIKVGNYSGFKFVSGEKEATQITVGPQETIELVTYNRSSDKVFLVLGKTL
jgi:hypothetical protein